MSLRILLVEDEPGLVVTLTDLLTAEGYEVESATDGLTGYQRAASRQHQLIILDVMLPGRNGFDICRGLREEGFDVPILMLTAKTRVPDRVTGLKLGADDYLAKPFDPSELLARVEALVRRAHREGLGPVRRFQFGAVDVDFDSGQVSKGGEVVNLAAKELQLLRYLIDHREKAVSRDDLLQSVWEYQPSVTSRTVDVHVAWLRQKLEENPERPRHLQTVRGVGYRFQP
ncbi:MAG: response regulator transcription factor [Bryobacteraceae bacterium]